VFIKVQGSSDLLMQCLKLGKRDRESGVYKFIHEYFENSFNDISEYIRAL